MYETAKRISTVTHLAGSTTGAPWCRSYDSYLHSLPSPDEDAKNQWIGPAAGFVGGAIRSRVLNNVIDCYVHGKCNTKLQQDTNNEEISALVQVMDEINAAKESLNALKKISMKDDHTAEAQFNEVVISSIGDTLGNSGDYLIGAAKKILCG